MQQTIDRQALIAELLAPYAGVRRIGRNDEMSAAWALISGTAELAADALLERPDSAYWRNSNPIEDGADGAAIRWLRESASDPAGAQARFEAYATVPGAEHLKRTANTVRWMIESNYNVFDAIAHTSPDGDESIHDEFQPHVRERLLRALPAAQRRHARKLANDWR